MRWCIAALAASLTAAPAGVNESARRKFELLERDLAPPGSSVRLTSAELTAYAREQAEIVAPGAVQDVSFLIGQDSGEATATINLLKVRQADGHTENWLMQQLLNGEHSVRTRVRLASREGRARVDIENVEIDGVAVQGRTLNFLLSQFVIPNFPDARVGEWFEMGHHIDRIEPRPGAAYVWIAKPR